MIRLDDREPDYAKYLPPGVGVVTRLEYGDAEWIGNGPAGEPVLVGVERKSIGDLLNSITSGRFAGHQLPGLLNAYHVVYLLVEGLYRPSWNGLLEIRQGKGWIEVDRGRQWMYADVESWLATMEQMAGLRVRRSSGERETAEILLGLYRWWTSKDYQEHRAHLTLHRPPETATLRKASLVRVMAAELPGVGWEKSERVARHFRCVADMIGADQKEWMEIEGIGTVLADRIVQALWGEGAKKVKDRRA